MVICQALWLWTEETLTPSEHWVISGDICGVRMRWGGREGDSWQGVDGAKNATPHPHSA